MNTLLIIYKPGVLQTMADPNKVGNYLKSHNGWAKINDNTWMINSRQTASSIRDDLKSFLGDGNVVIFDVTKTGWATYNVTSELANWMKNNI